ncbi:alpha/beta-hydrolase [Myriangium duriaei CBS 260.36]|uniref:Alpha/beta-hydrolase n=1 Tax=Myriangium duriaei CBS 260.36 TaxID=1168546 RepID=A0A9P4J7L3_9PEZI|nr:alpha/beta-hydrolase [Myriangium duriaei CBS 260.36]
MSCPQCFSGHVNPGSPTGRFETVYNRRTYVAEPPDGKQAQGIIVIIPDAFGVPFVNNQILADHYASAGSFLVLLPDFMDGKEAKVSTMINMAHLFDKSTSWLWFPYYIGAVVIDFVPFMIRNRFAVAWPKVTSFLSALREDKGARLPVGVAGFCWGGLHVLTLTHDRKDTKTSTGQPLADAFFTAHPSNLTIPQDIEACQGKLSIAVGDDDAVMPLKQVQETKKILGGRTDIDSEVVIYPGAKHGFSVRASRPTPEAKETIQAEEAEKQAIAWFQRCFRQATP